MTIMLKSGASTEDPRLDRVVQFDERSRNYPVRALLSDAAPQRLRSYTWSVPAVLDQGREGRCVEYSICHELLARPVKVSQGRVDDILANKRIYWTAQQNDQWPGGSYPGATPVYEGTSVLAGIKAAADLGFYTAYDWAFGLQDLVLALGYHGPAVLGINWYNDMFDANEDGYLTPTGGVAGGHAILARGVHLSFTDTGRTWTSVDQQKSYVTLHNSWGPDWGRGGTARVSLAHMDQLLREDGECCLPRTRVK